MHDTRSGLSAAEIEKFDNSGYVILTQRLAPIWIEQLRFAAEAWIETGFERKRSEAPLHEHGMVTNNEGSFVFSVENLHNKGRIESLELLGHPFVRQIVTQLLGEEWISIYEGLMVRQFGDKLQSPWRQDAIHDPSARALSVLFALDPYTSANGGERFLAGSHKEKQDICSIRDTRGWSTDGLDLLDLEAGDVLLYDPMIAHCAPKMNSDATVRLIDFRFRTPQMAESEGFSAEWIQKRKSLTGLAQWAYAKLHDGMSEKESFASDGRTALLGEVEPDIAGLYSSAVIYPAANFCLDYKTGDKIRLEA